MGTYNIAHSSNTLTVKLEGKFDQQLTAEFVKAFQTEVGKINAANTELVFLAENFQVLGADMHDTLAGCFKLYQTIGFKKISMNLGKNMVLKMQVNRIAIAAGLKNFEMV